MLGQCDRLVDSAESIERNGLGSQQETSGTPSLSCAGDETPPAMLRACTTLSENPPSWTRDLVTQIVSEVTQGMEKNILQNLRDLSYALRVISNFMQDSQHSSCAQRDEEGSWSSGSVETPKAQSSGSWSGSGSSNHNPTPKTLPRTVRNALGIKIPSPEVDPASDRGPKVSSVAGSSSNSAANSSSGAASSSDAAPARKSSRFGPVLTPVESRSPSEDSSNQRHQREESPLQRESGEDQQRPPRVFTGNFGHDEPGSANQEQQNAESQVGQDSPGITFGFGEGSCGGAAVAEMSELQREVANKASHEPSLPQEDISPPLVPGAIHESKEEEASRNAAKLSVAQKASPEYSSSPLGLGAEDESQGVQPERDLSFQDFENSKEQNGNRTPCSLFDMEEHVLLLNLEHLHRKKKRSKKPRRQKSSAHDSSGQSSKALSRIIPERSADLEEPEKASENETGREIPVSTELRKLNNKTATSEKYETSLEVSAESSIGGKIKGRRSLDQLYSDHAQDILNDYIGVKEQKSARDPGSLCNGKLDIWYAAFCGSRPLCALKELPEVCLVMFGITRPSNEIASRIYFFLALLVKILMVVYVVTQDFAVEFDHMYYTSFMHSVIAIGALVSSFCLLGGRTGALLGRHCDAIQMYAQHNYFLDAWRTASFTYFCFIVFCCAAQSVLLVYEVPGADSNECRDAGLRILGPGKITAQVLVVVLMSMLAFLHLRMCAGLQLMVDSFCEDFKMGMDEIKAASRWNLIHGLMNRTTGTIGTCFLAQISTFTAALVPAGADVLVGNVDMDSVCAIPWLVNWLIPTLLGFFVVYIGLIECGRLTLKCSRVAGFVNTMRYQQVTRSETARNLRQYLTGFVHQTSSGFIIQGFRVTTFVAFKLGWALVTIAFAIWARSRST